MSWGQGFLEDCLEQLRALRRTADAALAQVPDPALHVPARAGTNSIAVLMKHMAGNMVSRWTEFLTSDGEKPWRNRDAEFVDDFPDRAALDACWERGWSTMLDAVAALRESHLGAIVNIRGEPHTVVRALLRQVSHHAYHTGQIVAQARERKLQAWRSLSIPPGGSKAYDRALGYDPPPSGSAS